MRGASPDLGVIDLMIGTRVGIVMRHGAEPWEDLAVKLMLKWPGLH